MSVSISAGQRSASVNRNRRGVRGFIKMTIGIIGRKAGMTRVFSDDGTSTPVTVIEAQNNRVTQVKTLDNDGYRGLQVAAGSRRASRVTKAMAGHFSKAGVTAGNNMAEFRLAEGEGEELQPGTEIKVDIFSDGQMVDVSGISIGKGFAGVVKRHNFSMQDATHGNSLSHRAPGSIGQNQTPGRVFKGKKMAGHMGNKQITIQSLRVVRVDVERGLLLIKGSVPGSKGGRVTVFPSVKAKKA